MLTSAVDLNADLGEEVTDDDGLLGVVTSADVACGYHAGTPAVMRAVCAEAVRRGDDVLVIHRLIHICVEKPLLPVEHGTTSVDVPVGSAECCANPLRGGSAGA